jgi:hypothetical protein
MGTNLIARLAKASAEVGGKLKADKRNNEQGYAYVSADKILSVCGQALSDNGIMIIPSIVKQEIRAVERQGKSPRQDAMVEFVMTITDGESSLVSSWFGMGSDYMIPDKALYKAITSGHKYFLSKLFAIGEGNEDSEHEPAEEERSKPAPVKLQPDPKPALQRAPMNAMANEAMKAMIGEEIPPRYNSWPKATIDAIVTRYKLTHPKNAEGMLNLSKLPYDTALNVLVEWCDEYRGYRLQVNDEGKQIYTPEQAAEMVAEARAMKAEIAQSGE